jgi:hypothetical protein
MISMNLGHTLTFIYRAPLTGAEVPSPRLRDKSAVVGWSFQNLWAFVVTFVVPYLINDAYAGLQSKVGFIFGSICVLGLVWAYFFFPELKGRSLEEIDEFFQAKVPAGKSRGKIALSVQTLFTAMLIM